MDVSFQTCNDNFPTNFVFNEVQLNTFLSHVLFLHLYYNSGLLHIHKFGLFCTAYTIFPELTIPHKNNETNNKFYRKVAFLMYTETVNFMPQS